MLMRSLSPDVYKEAGQFSARALAWTPGRRLERAFVRGAHLCAWRPRFRLMKRKQVSKVKGSRPNQPPDPSGGQL
jgi:hypothetical protein